MGHVGLRSMYLACAGIGWVPTVPGASGGDTTWGGWRGEAGPCGCSVCKLLPGAAAARGLRG